MDISLNWVNEFVELPKIDADDLANSFTMTTAEVEDVKTTNMHLTKIIVAQIKSIRKHPEADKLNLVTFDYGAKETKEVVCGAPNVRENLKVAYAPLGVTLPNGLTLEPKKIRGYLSEGMLCSETELGIGEGSNGIMELPEDAQLGMSMQEFLNIDSDTIIEVDNKSLTHRPDLWGHLGIAREFAAAYDLTFKKKFDKVWSSKIESLFSNETSPIIPSVEEGTSCKAYWGISVDNIKVSKTPSWMINKLEACGIRSINSIVDISNYVMLELGIPLHIFDRSKIQNNSIIIKNASANSTFTTLDEIERKLVETDTMVCDSEKPLVLAGVMGGLNSGVDENTTSIFIEVANWKADNVRRTSTRLGLRTDSSQRYEKSLDSKQCYQTLLRTLELIFELNSDAKIIGKPEYAGERLEAIEPLTIKTSYSKIRKVLGHDVTDEKINKIFSSLEFIVENKNNEINVTLPSFRTTKDIEYEACLIEEVGRFVGYDNIIPESPLFGIQATSLSPAKKTTRKIQDYLTYNARALEIMTYPLIGKKLLEKAKWPVMNEELELVNALSKDADRMRPSLIPHALNTVSVNAKNFDTFKFYEIGRSYLPSEKNFSEERTQLLIGFYNKKETPFVELINTVEGLINTLNLPADFSVETGKFKNEVLTNEWFGAHPHEFTNIKMMGKFKGVVSSAHPLILKNFKVKGHFSFAVIDLTEVLNKEMKSKNKYTPISKFPTSTFDCTVIVANDEPAVNIISSLKKLKIKEISSKKIKDVFQLNDKERAVTLTVTFEDNSKTLDSAFLKESEDKIVSTLDSAGYPLKI